MKAVLFSGTGSNYKARPWALSLRPDRFQKLPGDVHMPRLVGMVAIPGDGAGMHVDKERVPGALQVDEDEPVPLRETPDDLAVRVHPRAHGVGAVWLHEVRRHQDHALDVGQVRSIRRS